jgi:hypothetical protein
LNLQGDNVNAAAGIDPLAPKRLAAAIERHRPLRHHPDIDGIQVQLDCQTIRPMMAGLIQHNMPAGRYKQAAIAFEEETGGAGQRLIAQEG